MRNGMTFEAWKELAENLGNRAKALSCSIVAQARVVAREAGLDPSICFLHAHNAIVSREYGHPWPEVDYKLARKVLHLEKKSFEPGRLAEAVVSRTWKRVV